jgi:hypothetical protein
MKWILHVHNISRYRRRIPYWPIPLYLCFGIFRNCKSAQKENAWKEFYTLKDPLLDTAPTPPPPPIMQDRQVAIRQSWALAHFFEVCYPLPTQFFSLDRWRSCVHFLQVLRASGILNFPFRSPLKRSSLNQWFAERKRAKSLIALYYKIMFGMLSAFVWTETAIWG